MIKFILLGCIYLFVFTALKVNAQITKTVSQVVYNMVGEPFRSGEFSSPWGKHEGSLHGVPLNYSWADGAQPGAWLQYGNNQAISTWGQVYEWKDGSTEKNIRVHIRNMKCYAFANGKWQLLEEGTLQGGWPTEDYTSSAEVGNVRTEATGGISFTMASGYCFHWWIATWPRATLPLGTTAIFTSVEVKLIPNTDPNVDLSKAKYLVGVSNDYYPTTTSSGPGPWPAVAQNRQLFIKSDWQLITSYVTSSIPITVDDYRNDVLKRPLPPGVVSDGTPEVTVSITNNQSKIVKGTEFEINAVAIDHDGMVSKIEFYANNVKLGEANETPFKLITNLKDAGIYYIKAKAIDNDLNSAFSDSIKIIVVNSNPPKVSIVSPVNNALLNQGDNITISVSVSDTDGTISKVSFFDGETQLGESTSSPFDFTLSDLLPGNYNITAVATDNSGTTSSSEEIKFAVKGQFTYVEDFSDKLAQGWTPASGTWETLTAQYVSKTTTDKEFSIYNSIEFSDYSYSVDMKPAWYNWLGLVFNYVDPKNYYFIDINVSTVKVYLIKVQNAVTDTLYQGIYDGGNTIQNYNLHLTNGNGKTSLNVNGVSVFDKVVTSDFISGKIGLYDSWNIVTFDNVKVEGKAVFYPEVAITSPRHLSSYKTNTEVIFEVNAADADGSITQVELFIDGVSIGIDNTYPYSFPYTCLNKGRFYFTAKATDNDGHSILSTPIKVSFDFPLGINQSEIQTLNIYPNPVMNSEFRIDVPALKGKVQMNIFDITGKQVYSDEKSDPTDFMVNVSNLYGSGVYLIKMTCQHQIYSGKVLIP